MTSKFITVTIKFSIIDSLCKLITETFHNLLMIFAIFTAYAHKTFEIVIIEFALQFGYVIHDSVLLTEILT